MKILGADQTQGTLAAVQFSLLSRNVMAEIYRTIILIVALYGCEIWSLILREGHT
jgi:hypothetical protein